MIIIAHRGFWLKYNEQNSPRAFIRALDNGFGIEFDVRDFNNNIVISHDKPQGKTEEFKSILRILSTHARFKKVAYAINIKSDGIEEDIVRLVTKFDILKNSFVFDMSVPSMYIFYKKFYRKIRFASRHSEIEHSPILYNSVEWVWLDELEKHWISNEVIIGHIRNGKSVCIVSPELHKRQYLKIWKQYLLLPKDVLKKVYICTDFPTVATKFFNMDTQ